MITGVLLMAGLLVSPLTTSFDLDTYLEGSGDADFHGEILVSCDTPDGSRDAVFRIAQVDGSVVAWSAEEDDPVVTVGPGRIASSSDGTVDASVLNTGSRDDGTSGYTTVEEADGTFLGRDVTEVTIDRQGVERLRMVVDDATDAVLRTTSLDGDGEVYCDRRFLDFAEGSGTTPRLDLGEAGSVDATEPLDDAPASLPAETSGFTLADTYPVEEGTMSYYTDGFFSFAVVVTDRSIDIEEGADVTEFTTADGRYRRSYEAGRVTVTWPAAAGSMALVGDLPPDLTQDVIADLPSPVQPGFFGRIWTTLFG